MIDLYHKGFCKYTSCGLHIDSPRPQPHIAIGGAFTEVTGSKVCDVGTDSWGNARVKGTRIKGKSAICLK